MFVATGPIRLCHDCVVQTWGFGPEGEVRVKGEAVLVVEGEGGEGGRIERVCAVVDGVADVGE